MTPADRLQLELGAQHLHDLGARATAELLAEVAEALGGVGVLLERLGRYRRVSPAILRAVGGHQFPSRAPREVPSELRGAA